MMNLRSATQFTSLAFVSTTNHFNVKIVGKGAAFAQNLIDAGYLSSQWQKPLKFVTTFVVGKKLASEWDAIAKYARYQAGQGPTTEDGKAIHPSWSEMGETFVKTSEFVLAFFKDCCIEQIGHPAVTKTRLGIASKIASIVVCISRFITPASEKNIWAQRVVVVAKAVNKIAAIIKDHGFKEYERVALLTRLVSNGVICVTEFYILNYGEKAT